MIRCALFQLTQSKFRDRRGPECHLGFVKPISGTVDQAQALGVEHPKQVFP